MGINSIIFIIIKNTINPISWDRSWWKIVFKKECVCVCVCVCVCMTESLCCTAEIGTTL